MTSTRRSFLAGAAGAPAVFAQRRGARPAAAPRPNIVLILTDDLPAWALGCYGNPEIRTPNIDAFARAGTRFMNSLVCTPVCSASRATLFTGRTPNQHGILDFLTPNPVADPPQGQAAPPDSFARQTMLSDLLHAAGYRCGYSGKWHLGSDQRPGHGYEFTYTFDGGTSPYQDPVMYLNGKRRQERGYLADLITAQACSFIDAQRPDQPFFLTVSHFNPHTPYEGHPAKYYEMYANASFEKQSLMQPAENALREKEYLQDMLGSFRKCAAAITALDDQLPPLRRKLMEKGFFDNTLVIFTSDNGYLMGRHGLWSEGHASHPVNMYEEVMQAPMIWSWPGRVPVGVVRPELISFYDFLPSVCAAAGVAAPGGLCGRNYLPLATNRALPKGETWRDLVFGHFRYAWMARDNRFKLVIREEGQGHHELFDLRQDPGEFKNLYEDARYVTVRDRLWSELAAWRDKYC